MEGQKKHFSHTHNLNHHQMPEGTQITCSGCNSLGTGIVYVCFECNFFLHEQCFQASRSLKHPSHPSHPLTLSPFPTYPTNSFYCNSCNQVGTGFSYCCSHCEFDLHVQCAYLVSISSYLTPQTRDFSQNSSPYYPPLTEPLTNLNAPQNRPIPHANPSVPIPTYPPKAETSSISDIVKTREIIHFSHPHTFNLVDTKGENYSTQCSVCEEIISGSRYSCSKSSCDFHLDKSCFNLPQHILHKSHPAHPLILVSNPYDENGQFSCNACNNAGSGFTYHCATCAFDLHIMCSSLPEIVKRVDHEHPLKLVYSSPVKGKDFTFACDVCHGIVQENNWTYYCGMCGYGSHVDCVNSEEKESQNEESDSSSGNPLFEAHLQMQMLQIQSAMANQNAQSFQVGMARQNSQMVMGMSQSFHSSPSHIYEKKDSFAFLFRLSQTHKVSEDDDFPI